MTYHSKQLFHPPESRISPGDKWEDEVVSLFTSRGYTGVHRTTKGGKLDHHKIDITSTDPAFPFLIQCKATKSYEKVNYPKILACMPAKEKIALVVHHRTKEVDDGEDTHQNFVILKLQDFLYLTQQDPF